MADPSRPAFDINARMGHGVAMLQSGRLQEAWEAFAGVLEADPNNSMAHHLIGLVFLNGGFIQEGIASLRQSIALNPRDPAAFSNLGNALRDAGATEEALACFNQAAALQPNFPDAYNNRGVVLRMLERNEEALADYDRAIALNPAVGHVHTNRGEVLAAGLGRPAEALVSYDRAIALAPHDPNGHFNRAAALMDLRRFEEAVASFDRVVAIDPTHARAFINRGNALIDMDRADEALASYDRAIALQSDLTAQAHSNRSSALNDVGRHAEAMESSERALELAPDDAQAHTNRANALLGQGRGEEALEGYAQAIALDAGLAQTYSNRANALRLMGKHQEAMDACEQAFALDPRYADPLINSATVLAELGRYQEAVVMYDRALAIDSDRPEALWGASHNHLVLGDFDRGWAAFEARWRLRGPDSFLAARGFSQPLWLGAEPLAGKTILLHTEQGLGDTLQFCRYAPLVKALGATVIVEVEPALVGILSTLKGVDRLLAKGEALPPFDYHCPLMSLPLALKTQVATIPAEIPYLHVDPDKVQAWAKTLGPHTKLRVGLVWSGGHRLDQPELWALGERRNIPLARLAVLNTPDVEFHSLQKGQPAESELPILEEAGWDGPSIAGHAAELNDFTDTAALIMNLDLVIAVDTSTAHLAGALGKPVWLLNRFDTCWRWLTEREDSPWYPSLRLFRQATLRDWDPVLERMKAALEAEATAFSASA